MESITTDKGTSLTYGYDARNRLREAFTGPPAIGGDMQMSGTALLNNALSGSATKALAFAHVVVGGTATGPFAGTDGDSVTWSGFVWNPPTIPIVPLWTFTDAGTGYTYSFNLESISVATQNNFLLNLIGKGTLAITGAGSPYNSTPANWSFTIKNPDGGVHSAHTFICTQTTAAATYGYDGAGNLASVYYGNRRDHNVHVQRTQPTALPALR